MKYHNILKDDMRNGDGLRVVLFVSGCEHHCRNCQNPITWDPNYGIEFDMDALCEIVRELQKKHVSGLTLSGGDPLHPCNRTEIETIARFLKKQFEKKTIWLYTGYTFDQIKTLPLLEYVDVIVDGRFVEELADVTYHWAGSTNQKIWRKTKEGEWKCDG